MTEIPQRRSIYLALLIVGTIVPMTQFVPWVLVHGLNLKLLAQELFANRISSFFALDLLLTGVVVLFVAIHGRHRVRLWWAPVLATVLLGVSAGLPLLLYLRERDARSYRT